MYYKIFVVHNLKVKLQLIRIGIHIKQEYRTLILWLRLANKSAQKTCLLGMDVRQISPLDSTIVPWMADKSAELMIHAKHERPINLPRDYKPWKDENLCLSILGLVYKSGN